MFTLCVVIFLALDRAAVLIMGNRLGAFEFDPLSSAGALNILSDHE